MGRMGWRFAGLALGLGLFAGLGGAAAADWAPAPFKPELGSRWRIAVRDSTTDSIRATDRTVSYSFELTYEAREGEGYRILYVLKEVSATGNAPSVPVARAAVEALKDVPVHAVTDAAGRPIRVDNEQEVATAVRKIGDGYVKALSGNPQLVALVGRVFDEIASNHGPAAAEAFLAPLPELARAQETDLKPGEIRKSESALASPFGGAIKSIKTLSLASDPAPDHYAVVETERLDEASLKASIAELTKRLAPGGDVSGADIRSNLPQITLSVVRTQRIDVLGGMARTSHMQETTNAKFAGQEGERVRKMEVTVAAAP